ncbi:MAG TPA: hypothetical protein VMB73_27500 [Acetobacteraceae bacterium]|jgi:hypothetical protein|nr:hypothetical protein [Acetobacteraceae bacterium]
MPSRAWAATRRLLKGDVDEILARQGAMFRERRQSAEVRAIFAAFLAERRR